MDFLIADGRECGHDHVEAVKPWPALNEMESGHTDQGQQKKGYAEHDPRLDTDGTDAAQKLALLARAAFDIDLPFNSIRKQGIESLNL